ncbi:branched-chain amino acid ABC transporter permease [Microbacterium gorillae]|uniref:branched-chain amino acid ABC transporter permease n=1 Tax=Microbacterium gorillae TaxID=1231063 RepID=UPI00069489D8|nr:branched-chain amino acid ABC transporter permease [Microbacterium gorillae]
MASTTSDLTRPRRWTLALLVILIAFASVLLAPATAHAAPGDDQEKTDFYFAGTITFDDKPVPDVVVEVDGNGFKAHTKTDAEGKWRLYVPEKAKYTITVDESTLPKGVIVGSEDGSSGSASQEVEFGLTGSKIVNLFLGEGVRQTTSKFDEFLGGLVNGINFGLLLALAAMGAALVYGTTGLSNFSHGEMVSWGAVVALIVSSFWHLPLWLGVTAAIVGGVALGLAMDAGLWRPLRRRGLGTVQLMIVSIGLSLALRYALQFLIGGGTAQLPGASPDPMVFGPIRLSYIDLISMGVSIIAILGVIFFLRGTRVGKATRAISDNPQLAAASGINVDRVIRLVWMLAGGLAALSGVLWAYFRPGVKWDMGTGMLLLIFSAITLGGLGSATGALIGALIIGIVVETCTVFGVPSDLKYAGALVVLIIMLLVRPQGLLGRKERLG